MSQDLIYFSIPNWEKFNEREGRKNYTWFRFENNFIHDPKIFSLSCCQKMIYLTLLCEFSKTEKQEVLVSKNYIASILKIEVKEIEIAFHFLKSLKLILLKPYENNEIDTIATSCDMMSAESGMMSPTNKQTIQTDNTDNTNKTDGEKKLKKQKLNFDFESLYKKFPRKGDKQSGLSKFVKYITSQEDYDNFSKAIDHYSDFCKRENKEKKYIKLFHNFILTTDGKSIKIEYWKDWIHPEVDSTTNIVPIQQNPQRNFKTFDQIQRESNKQALKDFLSDGEEEKGSSTFEENTQTQTHLIGGQNA